MEKIFTIGIGGFLGSVARAALSDWIGSSFTQLIPYGTLVVNVVGCGFAGAISAWFLESPWGTDQMRNLICIGFLGAFTTFSTFSTETVSLFLEKAGPLACLNIFAHVILCMVATYIGVACVSGLNS